MASPQTLLYYSVNTLLSHRINNRFYGGCHYVWCSPIFDPTTLDQYHIWRSIPPSSSPKKIYYTYKQDVEGQDYHSALITQNRSGIIKGATKKFADGIIGENELQMIMRIVEKSTCADFKPVLYLIPESIAKLKIQQVPVEDTANPLSVEYRILDLMNGEFEVIEVGA